MQVELDTSELRAFAHDLGLVPDRVQAGMRPVVSKGALNIKKQMQGDLASSGSFKGITFSVSYDLNVDVGGIEAEIGPDKSRFGGALANIAYFGSSRGGGGTVPDPRSALEAEVPRFEKALGRLVEEVL